MRSLSGLRRVALAALLILLTAGATSASAATYTWAGGSGNWNEAGHWIAQPANPGPSVAPVQPAGGTGTPVPGQGTLTNTGTLHVQSGTLSSRGVVNSGTILVDSGAMLHATTLGPQSRGVVQNAGTIANNGV